MQFSPSSCYFLFVWSSYSPQHSVCYRTLSVCVLPLSWGTSRVPIIRETRYVCCCSVCHCREESWLCDYWHGLVGGRDEARIDRATWFPEHDSSSGHPVKRNPITRNFLVALPPNSFPQEIERMRGDSVAPCCRRSAVMKQQRNTTERVGLTATL
jgi:hypothetical protein